MSTMPRRQAAAQIRHAAITRDVEKVHVAVAALQPTWSWSKCRRYARRLVLDERYLRAAIYARISAAPADHGFARADPGTRGMSNMTATRAAHNTDFTI